jgi:hypothetical protein
MNDFKFILQWKIGSKPQAKSPRLEKAFLLKEFSEGRKNQEAYTVFFDHFVPCATIQSTKLPQDNRLNEQQRRKQTSATAYHQLEQEEWECPWWRTMQE